MNTIELRVERLRKKLNQKDIAKMVGMNEISYCRKENGTREFTRDEVKRVALALELDMKRVNEIFFDNELTECNI